MNKNEFITFITSRQIIFNEISIRNQLRTSVDHTIHYFQQNATEMYNSTINITNRFIQNDITEYIEKLLNSSLPNYPIIEKAERYKRYLNTFVAPQPNFIFDANYLQWYLDRSIYELNVPYQELYSVYSQLNYWDNNPWERNKDIFGYSPFSGPGQNDNCIRQPTCFNDVLKNGIKLETWNKCNTMYNEIIYTLRFEMENLIDEFIRIANNE